MTSDERASGEAVKAASVFGKAAQLARFGAEPFTATPLFANERVTVLLTGLEPGQQIPLHAPGVDMAVSVLEGEGDLWVDDTPHPVAPGDVAVIPAGATRGARARGGRLVMLHVASPPPTAADHSAALRPWPADDSGS